MRRTVAPLRTKETQTLQADDFPALAEVLHHLEVENRAPFRGCRVVFVQHVHTSLVPLVDAVLRGGADLEQVTVVAKAYSARPLAVEALRERGVRVGCHDRMRDPTRSYEIELEQDVEGILDGLDAGESAPLLVLDEGAVAARVLARRPRLASRARVVEQTTRGARWADSAAVGFPVVDVARSQAKAEYEAPLVARSMAAQLALVSDELNLSIHEIGLIGYGRMGARLADALGATARVVVHEVDEARGALAAQDGVAVRPLADLLSTVDVVVGCTGGNLLREEDVRLLGRSVALVNGASSDIEFALWRRRRAEAIVPGSHGDALQPWRNHYAVDQAPHRHVLVAGGFPINFYGTEEPLSPREFQLTRALMLAGAVQAMGGLPPGVTPLEDGVQRRIVDAYASERAGEQVTA